MYSYIMLCFMWRMEVVCDSYVTWLCEYIGLAAGPIRVVVNDWFAKGLHNAPLNCKPHTNHTGAHYVAWENNTLIKVFNKVYMYICIHRINWISVPWSAVLSSPVSLAYYFYRSIYDIASYMMYLPIQYR